MVKRGDAGEGPGENTRRAPRIATVRDAVSQHRPGSVARVMSRSLPSIPEAAQQRDEFDLPMRIGLLEDDLQVRADRRDSASVRSNSRRSTSDGGACVRPVEIKTSAWASGPMNSFAARVGATTTRKTPADARSTRNRPPLVIPSPALVAMACPIDRRNWMVAA